MISASIDKIVINGNVDFYGLKEHLAGAWFVKKCYVPKGILFYQINYQLVDGTFLIIGTYGIRLQFNPNNCIPEIIHGILPYILDNEYKISRIDIAIDYNLDLSKFVWFEKSGRRKIRAFRIKEGDRKGELTGVYFGKRKSQYSFVIYNKGYHNWLLNKCPKDTPIETLWRVEARLKYPSLDNILPLEFFDPLSAGGVKLFPSRDTRLTRLRRFPEQIKVLSTYRRKKARRLAIESDDRLEHQPRTIYQGFRAEMFASLSRYILIPLTGENYTSWNTYDISNDLISYEYFIHRG